MSSPVYTPPKSIPVPVAETHEPETRVDYLNVNFGVKSWLLTTDHKRIAIMYLIVITLMFFLGGAFAVLVRLELATPESDLMGADTFNRMFTMHGIVMVFFFLIPAIPSILGNFLVPLMIGAKDLAFPRLNLASWYVYLTGATLTLIGILQSGIDTGWTFYVPYSTRSSHTSVMPVAVGVLVLGFSSIMTALNFIVTIHTMRAPGMTWFRMPLFLWSMYATSIVIMLGTPVISITLMLVAVERILGTGIFDYRIGGDPILFQHLFWFYSHPAVYIMILPAMGVISELVPAFARKMIFGYEFVAFSSMAIAVFSFLVWGHHMFVTGMSPYAGMIFSFLSYAVAIPSAIKVFNWTATLYKGSISWSTPMLYAIGFIGLFSIGGMTGLVLAAQPVDVHVTDTYFIVAHFHYVMVGGTIMAYLGGLHFWWPKMTGRMYPEGWAKAAALIIFVGFNLTFFPQFIVGYQGMPRRVAMYAPEFQVLNVMSTAGASILGLGFLLPFTYFAWSLRYAKAAGPNPFGATGLEWETESPPPPYNFDVTPVVTSPPYLYHAVTDHTGVA